MSWLLATFAWLEPMEHSVGSVHLGGNHLAVVGAERRGADLHDTPPPLHHDRVYGIWYVVPYEAA